MKSLLDLAEAGTAKLQTKRQITRIILDTFLVFVIRFSPLSKLNIFLNNTAGKFSAILFVHWKHPRLKSLNKEIGQMISLFPHLNIDFTIYKTN